MSTKLGPPPLLEKTYAIYFSLFGQLSNIENEVILTIIFAQYIEKMNGLSKLLSFLSVFT